MSGASLTSLDARVGLSAGEITPTRWVPPEGTHVLVLGDDAGLSRVLAPGEYIEATQRIDYPYGAVVRFRAHLRPPASAMPSGLSWVFSTRRSVLNSTGGGAWKTIADRSTYTIGRELDRNDITIPIWLLLGFYYGFRLTLDGPSGTYEAVPLPAAYVDAIIFDLNPSPTSPIVCNRVPEPSETSVPTTSTIYFELVNSVGSSQVDLRQVYVNGVLAYDAGAGGNQNGFALTSTNISAVSTGAVFEIGYTVTPPAPFTSEEVVTVRVVATLDDPAVPFTVTSTGGYTLTATGHPFIGRELVQVLTTGTLPSPLNTSASYVVSVVDANTIQLLDGPNPAAAPTIGPYTTTGSGTHTLLRAVLPRLDTSYSFTIADVTPPRVVAAIALDAMTIRVGFSENVVEGDGTTTPDALNPANWSISLLSTSLQDGLPAVPLSVVSAAVYDTATVDLTTDVEMTPGAAYLVAAVNIDDLAGNAVASPYNTAGFAGYADPPVEGRSFDLLSMLPAMNLTEDASSDLQRFVACLQEPTNLLLGTIDKWTNILDPDVAAENFVDVMLKEAGNPFLTFTASLSLNDKRRLLRILVPIYKSKGTDQGIINAIRFFLGITVTITVPWAEGIWSLGDSYLGTDTVLGTLDLKTRFTFYINSPVVLTATQLSSMTAIAAYMKDARTHFFILQPSPPPTTPDSWELGLDELGVTTLMH